MRYCLLCYSWYIVALIYNIDVAFVLGSFCLGLGPGPEGCCLANNTVLRSVCLLLCWLNGIPASCLSTAYVLCSRITTISLFIALLRHIVGIKPFNYVRFQYIVFIYLINGVFWGYFFSSQRSSKQALHKSSYFFYIFVAQFIPTTWRWQNKHIDST